MRRLSVVGPLLLIAAACTKDGQVAQRIPADSSQYFRTQVEQLTTVAAAKDSLVRDLAETTKLVADINTEIFKVSRAKKGNEPVVGGEGITTNDRAIVLKRVQDLTARLASNESRLAASQKRLRQLTGESDSLKRTFADFQATIDGLQATLESQKNTIATMEADLTGAKQQVASLTEEKTVLTDTVSSLTTRENTVYYVIGTRKELKDKGIITEEGGTRFLIFTRTGEVLKPAPNLDPAAFTAVDRRTVTEIKLPDPAKEYQLVTMQNIAYSNIPLDAKGRMKGSLQITSPERFWGTSKFLILVER
jgi:predicted  nucleic acid-binding Zn-ribbon protein